MLIPGLTNVYLIGIVGLEFLMICARVLGYGPAFAAFGSMAVAAVAYFHLTLVKTKVRPLVGSLRDEDRRAEMRWLVVIAPIFIMWINSVPISGKFPIDYAVDIWKSVFFIAVMVWCLVEGAIRIRF